MRKARPAPVARVGGSVTDAYLRDEAASFFPLHYRRQADRLAAVRGARRPLSPLVWEELARQNRGWGESPAREASLAALKRGAVAVVTGQQVGLFLGPLFTLYKAATAIKLAKRLEEETGIEAVPVFWLQTEDHDLPEIASCSLPGRDGEPICLRLPADEGDRTPVAHRRLPEEVAACLEALRDELELLPYGDAHLDRLERHYRPGASWSEAFAGYLAELFAEEGLLLLDPRAPALAPLAAQVHERALRDAEGIAAGLEARSEALKESGYAPAVHVRRRSPLSFFHPEGAEGPRYRLEGDEGGYREVGGEGAHTEAALLEALRDDPLRFSTSALLRPILQDTLLPTAAYVGGPGEIAYLAQVAPLYERYGLPMPLIVPRGRFRVVDKRVDRRLARLGLDEAAVEPRAELLERIEVDGGSGPSPEEVSRRLADPFLETLQALGPALEGAGPGMERAVRRTRFTVERAVSRLVRKYRNATLRNDTEVAEALAFVRAFLLPDGAPQERCHGVSFYAARFGERDFLRAILESTDPLDPSLRSLRP